MTYTLYLYYTVLLHIIVLLHVSFQKLYLSSDMETSDDVIAVTDMEVSGDGEEQRYDKKLIMTNNKGITFCCCNQNQNRLCLLDWRPLDSLF